MGVLFLSPFSFYMYVCFVLTIFISFVVLCCKFLGLAMVLAKFCCQAMCNFCSRRKILKEKKKILDYQITSCQATKLPCYYRHLVRFKQVKTLRRTGMGSYLMMIDAGAFSSFIRLKNNMNRSFLL